MTASTSPIFSNPPELPKPAGYTQIVETTGGRTIYLAGQIALDRDGKLVGEGNLELQLDQVFRNLAAALQSRGGTLGDVVKLTTYMLDASQLAAFRTARDRYIPPGPKVPASTLVEVPRLARPEFLVEIEAIAWLP